MCATRATSRRRRWRTPLLWKAGVLLQARGHFGDGDGNEASALAVAGEINLSEPMQGRYGGDWCNVGVSQGEEKGSGSKRPLTTFSPSLNV